jgi:NADPH:quinone reductase-like Zn-dependent oxidoreductase
LESQKIRPVVGKTFALKDAPESHRAVMSAGAKGKVVLVVE